MNKTFTLRSGVKIPQIGFGPGMFDYKRIPYKSTLPALTWRVWNKLVSQRQQRERFIDSIANALKLGFKLLDYSITYGNLPYIREAIKRSEVNRDDLFLTTRIGNKEQFKGDIRESFLRNLDIWGIEKIDLLQFHWPVPDKYISTWEEMIRLKDEGFVKVLGTANCHPHHIEALKHSTGILPEVNQVEVHPLFTQKPLLEYCKKNDIMVEAYTPVARFDDRLVRLPLLKGLERKYGKSFIQIILRWHIQNGVIPVVRTLTPSHQKSNINIFDFEITQEDMALIDRINIDSRLRYNPDNCDFSIL